ncbi:MAG: hypothetical protein M3443_18385 [Actinomycetota bacterium]|nr:hypothetical protein [Actinomycetota bacterium]
MLHLRLIGRHDRPDAATDPIGRTFFGWDPTATPQQNWENNRGDWLLGAAATRERYALFSYGGRVVLVAGITGLESSPTRPGKKMLVGNPLQGGRVYEEYLGRGTPAAVPQSRNPVGYFPSDVATWGCECGCGTQIRAGSFVTGHDQTALHERVAQIGTVAEFIQWFDDVRRSGSKAAST